MTTLQPSPEAAPPEPAGPGAALLLLIAAASALGPISTLMMIPALPEIRDVFGSTNAASQAIVSVFLITFAAGIPLAGPLSDRYGRRPLVMWGLVIFIVGTILATFAPTLEILIIARAIQAIGCAANTTVARAMLGDIYTDWRLARALANLTLVMMIGTSVSPYLGGVLTESFSWHAPFVLMWILSVAILFAAAFLNPVMSKADPQTWQRSGEHLCK
ncbi:MAG: MFS transporter [Steroidobacteraceae bacterium]